MTWEVCLEQAQHQSLVEPKVLAMRASDSANLSSRIPGGSPDFWTITSSMVYVYIINIPKTYRLPLKKIAESQKYMVFQPSIFGGGTLSFGVLIKERKKEGEEERNWDEMLDDFLVEWNSICTDVRHLHTSFHLTIAFDEITTVFSTNVNYFGFQNFGLRRCFTFYHNKSPLNHHLWKTFVNVFPFLHRCRCPNPPRCPRLRCPACLVSRPAPHAL